MPKKKHFKEFPDLNIGNLEEWGKKQKQYMDNKFSKGSFVRLKGYPNSPKLNVMFTFTSEETLTIVRTKWFNETKNAYEEEDFAEEQLEQVQD